MNTGGWIILILSISTVSILFAWCIYKVLTVPGETEKMHGLEIDPGDSE